MFDTSKSFNAAILDIVEKALKLKWSPADFYKSENRAAIVPVLPSAKKIAEYNAISTNAKQLVADAEELENAAKANPALAKFAENAAKSAAIALAKVESEELSIFKVWTKGTLFDSLYTPLSQLTAEKQSIAITDLRRHAVDAPLDMLATDVRVLTPDFTDLQRLALVRLAMANKQIVENAKK